MTYDDEQRVWKKLENLEKENARLWKTIETIQSRLRSLDQLTERQGNQIENAFNIFSKEGEHY